MARWNVGEKNGYWKGGRTVASNGYVLIRVGTDHHLADVRGYAYEHRLVAEEKIGRRLLPGELVHHLDENRQNNAPGNLQVEASVAHHFVHHRKPGGKRLRMPGEENPDVDCACGCGARFPRYDATGRPRTVVSGHNDQPAPAADAILRELAKGPLRRDALAEAVGKPVQVVATGLSKLKRDGLIHNYERGAWAIVGGPYGDDNPEFPEARP